jgi:hypothetical protein
MGFTRNNSVDTIPKWRAVDSPEVCRLGWGFNYIAISDSSLLVRNNMDVNEHERLSNIILKGILKLVLTYIFSTRDKGGFFSI